MSTFQHQNATHPLSQFLFELLILTLFLSPNQFELYLYILNQLSNRSQHFRVLLILLLLLYEFTQVWDMVFQWVLVIVVVGNKKNVNYKVLFKLRLLLGFAGWVSLYSWVKWSFQVQLCWNSCKFADSQIEGCFQAFFASRCCHCATQCRSNALAGFNCSP